MDVGDLQGDGAVGGANIEIDEGGDGFIELPLLVLELRPQQTDAPGIGHALFEPIDHLIGLLDTTLAHELAGPPGEWGEIDSQSDLEIFHSKKSYKIKD